MSKLDENVEYANKINELVDTVGELRTEVLRLRDLVSDIAAESPLRLVFAWHIRRRFPALRAPVRRMDVPPVIPVTRVVPARTTPVRLADKKGTGT